MNFKQLEVFTGVVKNCSFSKTAEECFLSQPTVSSYIHELETECGARLLVRSTKKVCPTRAGTVFYQYACKLLKLKEKALMSTRGCTTEVSGTLEMAASTVPAQYLMPAILSKMAEKYPDLSYSLREYDSCEVVRHIAAMDAEIGVVGTHPEDSHCLSEPFVRDQLVVITPNKGKYRDMAEPFPLRKLKSEPFLVREQGSGTRREMEDALLRVGFDPSELSAKAQLDGTESIKQAVSKGLGISIISRLAAEDYVKLGLLRMFRLEGREFERQFYFVYRKEWPLSPAAAAFMDTARNMLNTGNAESK